MTPPIDYPPYERMLHHILVGGEKRTDRTGTGTLSLFSPGQLTYNLRDGRVPLITSKAVPWKMALREFMWMLTGSTNVHTLAETSEAMAGIWDNWADRNGDIGPTYGAQYRRAGGSLMHDRNYDEFQTGRPEQPGVDQLEQVIRRLSDTPDTRRALISLWSVPELEDMALEPCMVLFQFSLRGRNLDQLHLHVYQRSADMMLGVPFDLFQAGLLTHLIAREVSIETGRHITATEMTWSVGDAHIYENQIEAVREVLENSWTAPSMRAKIEIPSSHELRLLDGTLTPAHIDVRDYYSAGKVSAPLAA